MDRRTAPGSPRRGHLVRGPLPRYSSPATRMDRPQANSSEFATGLCLFVDIDDARGYGKTSHEPIRRRFQLNPTEAPMDARCPGADSEADSTNRR